MHDWFSMLLLLFSCHATHQKDFPVQLRTMKARLHLRIYTHQIIEISYLQYDFDIIMAVRFDIFHK